MFGPLPFLFLAGVLALVVTVVALLLRAGSRPATVSGDHPGLDRLRRVAGRSRLLGLLAGLLVPFALAGVDRLGQGLVLVPAIFAGVQVLGVLIATLVSHRDVRRPGVAGLEVRQARDYLPRRLCLVLALLVPICAAVFGWTTAAGSPDDLGRPGRWLTFRCVRDCDGESLGPWPGSFYTVPLVVGLVSVLVLGAVTVVLVVRRPRNGAEPGLVVADDTVRSESVATVVASAVFALAASLCGVGISAGLALLLRTDSGPERLARIGVGVLAGGVLGLVAGCWALAALLQPLIAPRLAPGPTPSRPGQDRPGSNRPGSNRPGSNPSGPNPSGPNRPVPSRPAPGPTGGPVA